MISYPAATQKLRIKMLSSIRLSWLCCMIVSLILPFPSHASDPDPLQDICVADLKAAFSVNGFPCKPVSSVTSDDFVLDLSKANNATNPFGAARTAGDVFGFPVVNTQGLSAERIDLIPGGLDRPHTHPRASELVTVLKGKIFIGVITTDNKFFSKVLGPGMVFMIPRALVHFQINVGKENAFFFSYFNSQNPGESDATATLLSAKPPVPIFVLTKTFNVSEDVINTIISAQPPSEP